MLVLYSVLRSSYGTQSTHGISRSVNPETHGTQSCPRCRLSPLALADLRRSGSMAYSRCPSRSHHYISISSLRATTSKRSMLPRICGGGSHLGDLAACNAWNGIGDSRVRNYDDGPLGANVFRQENVHVIQSFCFVLEDFYVACSEGDDGNTSRILGATVFPMYHMPNRLLT
jgi:hypothetical protein